MAPGGTEIAVLAAAAAAKFIVTYQEFGDATVELNETLARAMCLRDGWDNADQTAHYRDGPEGPERVPRWQVYSKRVDLALAALADAGLVVLPQALESEAWRVAVADAEPEHPLGSYENRTQAYRAEKIFMALIAKARIGAPPDAS